MLKSDKLPSPEECQNAQLSHQDEQGDGINLFHYEKTYMLPL